MNNSTSSGIYCIINRVNGKRYIGQTNNFKMRKCQHLSVLKKGVHSSSHLQNAWEKYGRDKFEFFILEICCLEDLNIRENYWINHFKSWNRAFGYNLERAANGTGPRSPEIREAISKKLMGHAHSEETKKKISDSKKGCKYGPCSEERKNKQSQAMKGRKFSKEHRLKLSDAKKGTAFFEGKEHTSESKKKMREAKLGKTSPRKGVKLSDEVKQKMREARLRYLSLVKS